MTVYFIELIIYNFLKLGTHIVRNLFITLIILTFAFNVSCKKESGPKKFNDFFDKLCRDNNKSQIKKSYTSKTLKLLDDAVKQGIVQEKDKFSVLPLFNSKTEVTIVSEKSSRNYIDLKIKYLAHPVENMTGSVIILKMISEDGSWKIDMEREIKNIISRFGRGNEKRYLNKKMFRYQ